MFFSKKVKELIFENINDLSITFYSEKDNVFIKSQDDLFYEKKKGSKLIIKENKLCDSRNTHIFVNLQNISRLVFNSTNVKINKTEDLDLFENMKFLFNKSSVVFNNLRTNTISLTAITSSVFLYDGIMVRNAVINLLDNSRLSTEDGYIMELDIFIDSRASGNFVADGMYISKVKATVKHHGSCYLYSICTVEYSTDISGTLLLYGNPYFKTMLKRRDVLGNYKDCFLSEKVELVEDNTKNDLIKVSDIDEYDFLFAVRNTENNNEFHYPRTLRNEISRIEEHKKEQEQEQEKEDLLKEQARLEMIDKQMIASQKMDLFKLKKKELEVIKETNKKIYNLEKIKNKSSSVNKPKSQNIKEILNILNKDRPTDFINESNADILINSIKALSDLKIELNEKQLMNKNKLCTLYDIEQPKQYVYF